jgi:hypothetical protein
MLQIFFAYRNAVGKRTHCEEIEDSTLVHVSLFWSRNTMQLESCGFSTDLNISNLFATYFSYLQGDNNTITILWENQTWNNRINWDVLHKYVDGNTDVEKIKSVLIPIIMFITSKFTYYSLICMQKWYSFQVV